MFDDNKTLNNNPLEEATRCMNGLQGIGQKVGCFHAKMGDKDIYIVKFLEGIVSEERINDIRENLKKAIGDAEDKEALLTAQLQYISEKLANNRRENGLQGKNE
jgi:hypothetical protein